MCGVQVNNHLNTAVMSKFKWYYKYYKNYVLKRRNLTDIIITDFKIYMELVISIKNIQPNCWQYSFLSSWVFVVVIWQTTFPLGSLNAPPKQDTSLIIIIHTLWLKGYYQRISVYPFVLNFSLYVSFWAIPIY